MADININTINKYYGDVHVIKDVSLDIKSRSFTVLVGPSGCGKSTMLRMIAGLEDINSGTISIDGEVVNDLPPKQRNIAMVFQSYALYPHMTVFDNMAFGLKLEKRSKDEINERVQEAARILRPGGQVLVMELATHSEDWVLEKLGHKWLGFEKETLLDFMQTAGFNQLHSEILPFRREELFQIMLAAGRKT